MVTVKVMDTAICRGLGMLRVGEAPREGERQRRRGNGTVTSSNSNSSNSHSHSNNSSTTAATPLSSSSSNHSNYHTNNSNHNSSNVAAVLRRHGAIRPRCQQLAAGRAVPRWTWAAGLVVLVLVLVHLLVGVHLPVLRLCCRMLWNTSAEVGVQTTDAV